MDLEKIGFGGGCHWCTEAVFDHLKGVHKVEQGWISSIAPNDSLSEAVIVHFDPEIISLSILIEIHLLTHASTSDHSMRGKYRSAVYSFSTDQLNQVSELLTGFSDKENKKVITKSLLFNSFKASDEKYQDYYKRNPGKPFCQTHIDPKIKLLMDNYRMATK